MTTITVGAGQRYQSIGAGIKAADAGDTVLVAGGTYSERVTINKRITVKTTEDAKIRGNGTLVEISANNAVFDGFTIERIKWQSGRDDIVEVSSNGVTVRNCTIYITNVTSLAAAKAAFGKEKASGILFKSNNVLCENNEVWGACFGVAFSDNAGRNSVVRNCNLHHTIQSCLRINYSYEIRGLLVENCNLNYSYGEDGIQWQQDFGGAQGKATISNRGTFVRNCVLIGNGENAFDLKGADGHTIEGCLMTCIVGENNGLIDGSGHSISGTIGRGSNARSQNVRIRNCVVWNSKNGMNVFGPNFYYYNNTYIWNNYSYKGNNSYNGSGYDLRSSYNNCGFKNNLVAGHRGAQAEVRADSTLDIDHNVYCTNGGGFAIDGANKNWDSWRSGLRSAKANGADANSYHYTNWSAIKLKNCPEHPDNLGGYDFLPQANSPAYQAGGALTTCTSSDTSNRVPVRNAGWFCDGYGAPGVQGDAVTVGDMTANIKSINGNTLTLDKPVTFRVGTPVYWGSTARPNVGIMDIQAPTVDSVIRADFVVEPNAGIVPLEVSFTDQSFADNGITTWNWRINGQEFAQIADPTYTIEEPGDYTVELIVSGPDGSDTRIQQNLIQVAEKVIAESIRAGFSADPLIGRAPLDVNFLDQSKAENGITAWVWEIDGTAFSQEQNPHCRFETPGVYSISLTVTGPDGSDTSVLSDLIEVTENTPDISPDSGLINGDFSDGMTGWGWHTSGTAEWSVLNQEAKISIVDSGDNTQLYQSGIEVVEGKEYILRALMRTDGEPISVTMSIMMHEPPYERIIDEVVTVTSEEEFFRFPVQANLSHADMRVMIMVNGAGTLFVDNVAFFSVKEAVAADFTFSPASGFMPLQVQFSDRSLPEGAVTKWTWKVNGQIFSNAQNPAYVFTGAGTYTVELTVEGLSSSDTKAQIGAIVVEPVIELSLAPDYIRRGITQGVAVGLG